MSEKEKVKYPQCEKVAAKQKESQVIGEFVGWLQDEKGVIFAKWDDDMGRPVLAGFQLESMLLEFFGIDVQAREKEPEAMLANIGG